MMILNLSKLPIKGKSYGNQLCGLVNIALISLWRLYKVAVFICSFFL